MSTADTACLASIQSLFNNLTVSERESAVIVQNSIEALQKLKWNYSTFGSPTSGILPKEKE